MKKRKIQQVLMIGKIKYRGFGMRKEITEKLEKIVKKENIYENEPMSKHTSFKIGGLADYFVKVETIQELSLLLALAKTENIPYQIIGNGTNLLVRDGGIRGLVIKLELKSWVVGKQQEVAYITVGAGLPLAQLALIALENGLSGLECMAGIPGTVGGAIRMNAGAFGQEMKDVVVFSKCMDQNGKIEELSLQLHEFDYRKSTFEKNGLILLETTIKLQYGKKDEIQRKMEECKKLRMKNQPLEFPNAGSIFKRNVEVPIAKLIDECGLKGYRIGDAEVSTKHAGFIVNKGNATASQVLQLIEQVKKEVKRKFEKEIKLEIIVIGEE